MATARGTLDWKPLSEHLDWAAPPVAAVAGLVPDARVAQIDRNLADTEEFCQAYDVAVSAAANCVVVSGRRGDDSVMAGVIVLATHKADVNRTVRKELGMRKLSFANHQTTEELTGMSSGGITPVGLPGDWPILIDEAVVAAGPVVIGGGVRDSKILLDGADLAKLPNARVLDLKIPQ